MALNVSEESIQIILKLYQKMNSILLKQHCKHYRNSLEECSRVMGIPLLGIQMFVVLDIEKHGNNSKVPDRKCIFFKKKEHKTTKEMYSIDFISFLSNIGSYQ